MKYDLRLVDMSQKENWLATYKKFGLRSFLTLMSPFLNTILNSKYKDYELDIKD